MGGDVRNSAEWDRAKKQAKRRDQYRCQNCRTTEADVWGLDLQVHHIRPVKNGGGNELENLVTLCNSCHWRLHRQHDGKERLRPGMIDDDIATFGFPDTRTALDNLNSCEVAILELLQENGPMQLKDIIEEVDYSRGYVQKSLDGLKVGKYVCRISRGVYSYITTLEYRRVKEQEPDEQGRREVHVWNPGEQANLEEAIGDGE